MQLTEKFSRVLLAIFAITMVPFNALHTHREDEHRIAVTAHDTFHACDLDGQHCQDESASACGHGRHIGKPIVKCFFCQFQFEKTYEKESPSTAIAFSEPLSTHILLNESQESTCLIISGNKDPPFIS